MIIPVGFGQATFGFTGSGVPTGAATTIGFANTGPATAQAIATELHDNFGDNIMPTLIQNVGLLQTTVKLGPNDTGSMAIATGERPGTDVSAQAPPSVAYLVTKSTVLGGRQNRGRMYLPGVDETEVDQAGTITSTKQAAVQAGVTAFFNRMNTFGVLPYILHNSAFGPTLITAMTVQSKVATQRRRLRR